MSLTANPPELIISLSHNKIGFRLTETEGSGTSGWQGSYPVDGIFLQDQVSGVLDTALTQQERLFEPIADVALLIMDRPNVTIPEFYNDDPDRLTDIAGKYLRTRAGDMFAFDQAPGAIRIAYSVPSSTIHLIREYFAKASCLHMTTVLWSAISKHIQALSENLSRVFFFTSDNTLTVIRSGKDGMTFSRTFPIQDQGDLAYYAIACHRMLRSSENWLVTIRDNSDGFEFPSETYLPVHHRLELPDLKTLISGIWSCAS